MPPPPAPAIPPPPPRPRRGRLVLRLLAVLGAALLGTISLLALLVRFLDHPRLKDRIRALAHDAGIDVDYGSTQVRLLSGLRINDLVVQTPPRFRALAPELLRLGTLEVRWSLLNFGARLTRVALRDLTVTVVSDSDGRTSLSELSGPPTKTAKRPTPLSRLPAELLSGTAPLHHASIDGVALNLVLRDEHGQSQRVQLLGLGVGVDTTRVHKGWQIHLGAGTKAAPLALALHHQRDGQPGPAGAARAALWLSATISPTEAQAFIDVRVLAQTLEPALKLDQLLTLEAHARFDSQAGRTDVDLKRLVLADGAATLTARAELRDDPQSPLLIPALHGDVDLVPLLRIVPAALLPLRARRARLRIDAGPLMLPPGGAPRLADGGHADVEGDFSGLRWTQKSGASQVALRDAHLSVHTSELRLTPAAPQHGAGHKRAVHARLAVSGQIDGLELTQPGLRAAAERIGLSVTGRLSGGAPYALDADLPLTGLQVADGKGRSLFQGPAHLNARLSAVYPDAADARRSRGELALIAEAGGARLQLDARKHAESLDFEVKADATSLSVVRPLWSDAQIKIPWERIALVLHSQGKVEGLFARAPRLSQRSELRLERPAFTSATGSCAAQGVALTTSSSGTARRHSGDLDLHLRGLTVSGESLDDVHLTANAVFDSTQRSGVPSIDADAPSLRVRLTSDAPSGPQVALRAALGVGRASKTIDYDIDLQAAKLAPLQPFLAKARAARGFALSDLALSLSGRGTIAGLLDAAPAHGGLRLAPQPLAALAVDGTLALGAQGVYWSDADRVVKTPSVSWRATLRKEGDQQRLHGELQLAGLHIEFGEHELDLSGVSDALDVALLGDWGRGEGTVAQRLNLGALQQDFVKGYALKDLKLQLRAQRDHEGEIRIEELKLDNGGGGTEMDLHGRIDVGEERRSLSLTGTLNQQLDRLWSQREVYVGRGATSLKVQIDSGNLLLYHAQAEVQVKDGNVTLPRAGVKIEGFSGDLPIIADVLLGKDGAQLLPGGPANIYSQLRYADQHPLLSGRSFISVARITTPWFTVADLAGNLRIDNRHVSLDQFELGLRGGRVSGQCLADLREEAGYTVQLRLRASHIQSSHGERFDGNAALVVGLHDRSVEGRSEILRIGRQHLLDLLALADPGHSDPNVNLIRTALGIGYPDRMSLAFSHGFATAHLAMGGPASLIRIEPVRGIPIGPILDQAFPQGAKGPDTEDLP